MRLQYIPSRHAPYTSRHVYREYFSATTLRYYDSELEREFCLAFNSNFAAFDARAGALNLLFPLVRRT